MLLIGAIVVLLLLLWWCRRKEIVREGITLSQSCGLLVDEQSTSDEPIPFCATGAMLNSTTKCKAMQAGRCRRRYKYPICPGNLEFENGECV